MRWRSQVIKTRIRNTFALVGEGRAQHARLRRHRCQDRQPRGGRRHVRAVGPVVPADLNPWMVSDLDGFRNPGAANSFLTSPNVRSLLEKRGVERPYSKHALQPHRQPHRGAAARPARGAALKKPAVMCQSLLPLCADLRRTVQFGAAPDGMKRQPIAARYVPFFAVMCRSPPAAAAMVCMCRHPPFAGVINKASAGSPSKMFFCGGWAGHK